MGSDEHGGIKRRKEKKEHKEDGGMSGETAGIVPDSIKGNPRSSYRATCGSTTPVFRLRHPPMIRMSCITQHANIRLIKHRGQFPSSFRNYRDGFIFKLKKRE
jgi:hypothetical protein